MQAALAGINAAVVGLLLSAFYTPVWVGAIRLPKDFARCLICWMVLAVLKYPAWLAVIVGIVGNQVFLYYA